MPKIISVLNQKGGTTKTTTSTNLAACIAARGHSVLIVDLNSDQGSATDWAAAQDGNDVAWHVPVISMGKQLARDLPRVAGIFRLAHPAGPMGFRPRRWLDDAPGLRGR